jgi:hypothetical protein
VDARIKSGHDDLEVYWFHRSRHKTLHTATLRRALPGNGPGGLPTGASRDLLSYKENFRDANARPGLGRTVRHMMSEADRIAIEDALQTNPMAIAEAESHLKKGLLILSQEIGLAATSNVVSGILARLHGDIPDGRLH